jgi:hypothetical protein
MAIARTITEEAMLTSVVEQSLDRVQPNLSDRNRDVLAPGQDFAGVSV